MIIRPSASSNRVLGRASDLCPSVKSVDQNLSRRRLFQTGNIVHRFPGTAQPQPKGKGSQPSAASQKPLHVEPTTVPRRLVEAGVRFVSFKWNGHGPGGKAHNWDDHAINRDLPSEMRARLPEYDHMLATLINELLNRGLNERVLLVVTGEFGRTPRLEYKDGRVGRDHRPSAMSILYSGGGLPMGRVVGQTNGIGARPIERPDDSQDFLATIYRFLGIDTHAGHPRPLRSAHRPRHRESDRRNVLIWERRPTPLTGHGQRTRPSSLWSQKEGSAYPIVPPRRDSDAVTLSPQSRRSSCSSGRRCS